MDLSVDLFYEDENHYANINVLRIRRKIRDDSNPLELPSAKFVSYFRLNKEAFLYVLDEIKDHLKKPVRMAAIPPILKLCAVLRFLADGSYQKCSGNDFNVGVAQSTMSLILKEVLPAIEDRICTKWIKTQMGDDEINASKAWFMEKCGFPGVLGCVDGTHVRIVSPRKNIQQIYMNRKGYYSLNVMIMCDYKMNVRYVDARHSGANHDSLIFDLSDLPTYFQRNAQQNTWILGDAGYPLRPYLMTPFRMADGGSPQARYNTIHAKGRNIVERTIGIVKSKFRCLLSVRGLHYPPEKTTQIVNVCCGLHNISQHYRVEFQADEIRIENENMTSQVLNSNIEDTEMGMRIRNNIMRSFQS